MPNYVLKKIVQSIEKKFRATQQFRFNSIMASECFIQGSNGQKIENFQLILAHRK